MGQDVGKYFIEAGHSFIDLLMRCNFRSERQRIATCSLAEYCLDFDLKEDLVKIAMLLAGSDSLNADRIERFLAAVTGGASRNGKNAGKENSIFKLPKYTKARDASNDGSNT